MNSKPVNSFYVISLLGITALLGIIASLLCLIYLKMSNFSVDSIVTSIVWLTLVSLVVGFAPTHILLNGRKKPHSD